MSANANSITYDITPEWENYGTVNIGIPAPGFPDGPILVDHYKNGKLIANYNGWVTSKWCTFDNPDGYSTFVIRKQGTNAQTAKRAYVPNTGVEFWEVQMDFRPEGVTLYSVTRSKDL